MKRPHTRARAHIQTSDNKFSLGSIQIIGWLY